MSSNKNDIGVLLVHGIGEQPRGETLIKFGEPLVQWLMELCPKNKVAGQQTNDNNEFDVEVTRKSEIVDDNKEYTPDSFLIHINDNKNNDSSNVSTKNAEHELNNSSQHQSKSVDNSERWLFAETWWADTFEKPKFINLAKWIFTIGPFVAAIHADRRAMNENRNKLVRIFKILKSLVFAFIIQIITVVLVILSIIPIQKWRNKIASLLSFLTATIGDAYVLVSSPVQRAAAVRRVLDGIDFLRDEGCENIVVIAHSQGAAIAAEALAISNESKLKLFVTYGAGIFKLSLLSIYHEHATINAEKLFTHVTRWLVPVCFISLLLSPTIASYFISGEWRISIIAYIAFLVGMPIFLFFNAMRKLKFIDDVEDTIGDLKNTITKYNHTEDDKDYPKWINFYSSKDPVSNGCLKLESSSRFKEVSVSNLNSFFKDHTAYWDNKDEFVSRITNELDKLCNKKNLKYTTNAMSLSESKELKKYEQISKLRKERVSLLFMNSIAVLSSMVLYLFWFGKDLYDRLFDIYLDVVDSDVGSSMLFNAFQSSVLWFYEFLYYLDEYYGISVGVEFISSYFVNYYNDAGNSIINNIKGGFDMDATINFPTAPDIDSFLVGVSTFLVILILLFAYKKIFFAIWQENDNNCSRNSYVAIYKSAKTGKQRLLWLKILAIFPVIIGVVGLLPISMTTDKNILFIMDAVLATSIFIFSVYIVYMFKKINMLRASWYKSYWEKTSHYIAQKSALVSQKTKTIFNNA